MSLIIVSMRQEGYFFCLLKIMSRHVTIKNSGCCVHHIRHLDPWPVLPVVQRKVGES